MKKKFTLLLLICILSALNINATIYNGSCGENVNYTLNTETGLLSITGTGAMTDYSYSNAPWYSNRSSITAVEISDGVTSIGGHAFLGCSGLTSVTIPNSVTSIGGDAFTNTAWYNNQPDGLVYAGKVAYEYKGTMPANTSITIKEGTLGIGGWAFQDCSGLTSVTIPNSVTSIGESAFLGCSGLTSVTIPNSVTSIGEFAFQSCSGLTSVTIPNSVTSIGRGAFNGCTGLTSVTIPNGVTSIGEGAFKYCSGLTSVTIPNSVTSIGNWAFQSCSDLTSVTIPNSVTSIGSSAFRSCSSLTSISVESGNATYDSRENCNAIIETATNTLVAGCKNTTIPNSVTSIGENAFLSCSGLTSITIPNSVTSIGRSAFDECSGLTSVTIPNSVTSIGSQAFWGCSGLTSVISEIEEPFAFGSNAFYGISSSCTLGVPYGTRDAYIAAGWTTDVFKGGIEEIEIISGSCGDNVNYSLNTETGLLRIYGTGAMTNYSSYSSVPWYSNSSSIKSVEISDGVTSIGDDAFWDCSKLTSITIPNSVTSIGEYAFWNCYRLTSVTIPNSVTSIGSEAFSNCSGLTSVTIPNSVTSIGGGAFEDCSGLTSISVENGNEKYDSRNNCNAIIETASNTLIVGCKNTTIPNSVTSIGNYAFQRCSGLTSVTIPNSVTSIGERAFYYCSGLTSIEIPNSVTSIGRDAFYDCSGLTSIEIPNSVTSIGRNAFRYCSGLTSVTIGNSVTSVGEGAFWNCYRLTSVTIPNSVTSIGNDAFRECRGLTSVTIPNSVTSIGNMAFSNCSGLTSVTIPNSVTSIGIYAFEECSSLTSVTIPNSVTSIGDRAFQNCSGLTSVTIPNSVTSIGEGAFSGTAWYNNQPDGLVYAGLVAYKYKGTMPSNTSITINEGTPCIAGSAFASCSGLTSVTIPNSVTSIGNHAFQDCSGLTSVTIPNSVTSIGYGAFQRCSGLTSVTIGNSVTSIGSSAFEECSGLTSVTSQIKEPFAFDYNAFYGISSSCTLAVPYGTRDAYIAAGWTTDVFKGGIVEMDPDAMNINMSANEIGTYCSPYDLDFSGVSGLKAYIMSGFSPSTSTLVLTPVTMVPAGTGLLLRGAEGNYEVPCTTTDMYYTNLLKGVTTATAIDPTDGEYTNFILSNGAHGIGFYTLSESGELAANKAYLQLPTASVASLSRAMRLVFADDITGIDEKKAETKKEDNIFYDLQGRRVDNPTQGLYIVNGKKVFINK